MSLKSVKNKISQVLNQEPKQRVLDLRHQGWLFGRRISSADTISRLAFFTELSKTISNKISSARIIVNFN